MDQWGSLQTPDQIFTLFSSEPTASALSVKELRTNEAHLRCDCEGVSRS